MNCTFHIRNPISSICIAPHKCDYKRKLCAECLDVHKVDFQYVDSIKKFQEKVAKKSEECLLQQTIELTKQRLNFKSLLSQTDIMLKGIWEEISEYIKQIYDLIEMEQQSFSQIISNNFSPAEISNTDLEKLVQLVDGQTFNDWDIQKNVLYQKVEKVKNWWDEEIKVFCARLKEEVKGIMSSNMNHPIIQECQIYKPKEDLYEILTSSTEIDVEMFKIILGMLQKEKNLNCIAYLSKSENEKDWEKYIQLKRSTTKFIGQKLTSPLNQIRYLTNLLKNIQENEFNKMNYSTQFYQEKRKVLVRKISNDKNIIEFLKFMVGLTAIDKTFIQCGSNSLNLLVEIKADLTEQNFQDIRIQETSLIGANFVRCNLSGSEFDNVNISGINLNGALLFNCYWDNIKIDRVRKLNGLSSNARSVCFSPNGTTLASGSRESLIRLWDVQTGQQISEFWGHSNWVQSVCFSPDGTILASASKDSTIRLWDVKSRKQIHSLNEHSGFKSICFSPDGTTLASGSDDKFILVWDVKTGQKKYSLDGHTDYVKSVCFSPDGSLLASGSGDSTIRLWDVETRLQKYILNGHTNQVNSVCFSPDGTTLASGSGDSTICLWDIKTGQRKSQLNGHTDWINSVCFSPDGSTLASGSGDSSIRLWDVNTGLQKNSLNGHTSYVKSICFSPDGTLLASGSNDKSIRIWDVKTGQKLNESDKVCQELLAKFQLPFQNTPLSIFEECANPITILLIASYPEFQAQGALIYKGTFIDYRNMDLREIFRQKGSCILERKFGLSPNAINN